MACAKHFPGHGRMTTDSHEGVPIVPTPMVELQQTDVAPFVAAVRAGVASVMPAFVAYPEWDSSGAAAGFSPTILHYLRNTLGFAGLVVTGTLENTPEGMVFPSRYDTPKGEVQIKALWKRTGEDSYRVSQSQRVAGET